MTRLSHVFLCSGKLVCNECSKTRAILTANDKNKIQRVCDDCIVLLKCVFHPLLCLGESSVCIWCARVHVLTERVSGWVVGV